MERERETRTELRRRLGIREDAKKILAESEGIQGIGREDLENAAKGGNAKSYGAMERWPAVIGKRLAGLKAMQHVGDPMAAAKKYGYPDTIAAEKEMEAWLKKWDLQGKKLGTQKSLLEGKIYDAKMNPLLANGTKRLVVDECKRLLAGVETEIKWEGFKPDLDAMKAEVKAHPKSKKLAAAYGKLEAAFNARNETEFNTALAEAKKVVPKSKKAAPKPKETAPKPKETAPKPKETAKQTTATKEGTNQSWLKN